MVAADKILNQIYGGVPDEVEHRTTVELQYNSMARARNYETLGVLSTPYLIKSLKSLRPSGGFVSLIDVFVIRKFPLLQKIKGDNNSSLK